MSELVFSSLQTSVQGTAPDLLATVAHEARTPLAAVIGLTERLRQMSLPAQAAVLVETIHTSGEQLLALVNDLLDSASLDAGRLVLEAVDFDLRAVAASAVQIASATSSIGSLKVEASIDPSLPDVVCGDARRFGQVLTNLLGNAVRFTPSGFVCLRMTSISRSAHAITCRVEVQDSGIGIDRAAMRHLFEPFVQADAATGRRYGGTGLGLSIAARIVAAMGSRIHVDSVPGTGSRFHFDVDFACGRQAPARAVPAGDGLRAVLATCDTHHRRVLVVEDDEVNGDFVRSVLSGAGLRVDVVTSGEAACASVASRAYDLILMDCYLPGMDGVAATRVIRAGGVRVPIVGVTACGASDVRSSCLEAGMTDVLGKPTRPSTLLDVVGRWLSGAPTGATPAPVLTGRAPRAGLLLEATVVAELTRLDLFVDMTQGVVRDMPSRLVDLGEAATRGDLDHLAGVAHRLTTVLGNVGWTRASAMASQVERACSGSCVGEARRHARALAQEVRAGLPELQRLAERAAEATSTCAH